MSEETSNPISVIRSVKRTNLKDQRNKHKELILSNKRLRLSDVSEYIHDVTISQFNELLSKLKQKSVPLEVLRKIKNSCVSPEYIEAVLKNDGAFSSLFRIFIGNDALKQIEATACLTNITCGTHKCSYKVAKTSGAYLVSFVNGSSHFLQEQSCWTLANIANDCVECFNIIKAHGVLAALLKALKSPFSSVIQCVVFALNACMQYDDPEIVSAIQPDLIKRLLDLLEENNNLNESIFLDTAFILSNCCFLLAKYSLNIAEDNEVERILILLQKLISNTQLNANNLIIPILRCVGFLSHDDRICEFLSLSPAFWEVSQLLVSKQDCIQMSKEIIWVLSNVTAGTHKYDLSYILPILDGLKVYFKMESSILIIQVLYFLSVLASKDKSLSLFLLQHEICIQIENLPEKEKDVSDAVTLFLKIAR